MAVMPKEITQEDLNEAVYGIAEQLFDYRQHLCDAERKQDDALNTLGKFYQKNPEVDLWSYKDLTEKEKKSVDDLAAKIDSVNNIIADLFEFLEFKYKDSGKYMTSDNIKARSKQHLMNALHTSDHPRERIEKFARAFFTNEDKTELEKHRDSEWPKAVKWIAKLLNAIGIPLVTGKKHTAAVGKLFKNVDITEDQFKPVDEPKNKGPSSSDF